MKKKVSIILPAYNEEKLLPQVVPELVSYLNKKILDYELLVIENGSQDRTLEVAKKIAWENKKIKVFHLPRPGYGLALLAGLKKAMGKYVIIFNVDFWDSRFIDFCLIDLLGYDLITGSKNLPGSRDERPLSRRWVTRFFNLFLRLFFGYQGTDTHGIKVLRRQTTLPIIRKCRTKTGIFDSEFLVRAQRGGLKILELPVKVREKRKNRFGFKRLIETPKDIIELSLALSS